MLGVAAHFFCAIPKLAGAIPDETPDPTFGGSRSMSSTNDNAIVARLAPLRAHVGARRTVGLDDATLAGFAGDTELVEAVEAAVAEHARIKGEFADLLELDEAAQAERSEEHTSELQSLMRTSYSVFCLQHKITHLPI